jgi:hypothetical protein
MKFIKEALIERLRAFAAITLFIGAAIGAGYMAGILFPSVAIRNALAADSSSYGGPRSGSYGEKKEVTTAEEAEKAFREYFSKKDVKIGEIKERELYFEAEIKDKNDNRIDKVIVDKRTGRIRSIY